MKGGQINRVGLSQRAYNKGGEEDLQREKDQGIWNSRAPYHFLSDEELGLPDTGVQQGPSSDTTTGGKGKYRLRPSER
jgi:hypothetical protein